MTIQEACQLVIQAAAIGNDGEALVLDMGQAVRIRDVAEQLIGLDNKTIAIEYTGLRPGEKMHEELFGHGEPDDRPRHPQVSHVLVPPLPASSALAVDPWDETCRTHMRAICADMAARLHSSIAA